MSLMINPLTTPAKPRRFRRLVVPLLGVAAVLVLISLVSRKALIHRMRLPRLTIEQGSNVIAVAITPNGDAIFTGAALDGQPHSLNAPADVFIWETASGRLAQRLRGFYWRSNAVTASPDGSRVLASGYTDRDVGPAPAHHRTESIVSWDWKTGRSQWTVPGSMPLGYSPDGRLIGSSDGIHEAATGTLVVKIPGGLSSDSQIAFSPDGKLFGFIGKGTLEKKGFTDSGNDDRLYYSRLYYSTMRLHLWRTDTGREVRDFPFTHMRAFDFSRDGRWLILLSDQGMGGGIDGSVIRRVDLATGAIAWTRNRTYNAPDDDPDAAFNSLVISPNGTYIVAESLNSQFVVLDAGTGHELFRPFSHQGSGEPEWALPGGLAFSADGRTLVSRCGHKALVWDASSLL